MNLSPFCRKHESVLCVLKFYIKLFIAKSSSYFPFVLDLCIIGRLITYIGISLLLYTLAPMEQNIFSKCVGILRTHTPFNKRRNTSSPLATFKSHQIICLAMANRFLENEARHSILIGSCAFVNF